MRRSTWVAGAIPLAAFTQIHLFALLVRALTGQWPDNRYIENLPLPLYAWSIVIDGTFWLVLVVAPIAATVGAYVLVEEKLVKVRNACFAFVLGTAAMLIGMYWGPGGSLEWFFLGR